MAKKTSKNQQNAYASYKTEQRWKINRLRKLNKLLKQSPNNLQIAEAIKNISYRRNTPKTQMWKSSTKSAAQLIKHFCGFCDIGIFNTSHDVASASIKAMNEKSRTKWPVTKKLNHPVDFSIKARVKGV